MTTAVLTTRDPIAMVCAYYRFEAARDRSYGDPPRQDQMAWSDHTNRGSGLNGYTPERRELNTGLYVVRDEHQTVIVQVSREKPLADTTIFLIASKR